MKIIISTLVMLVTLNASAVFNNFMTTNRDAYIQQNGAAYLGVGTNGSSNAAPPGSTRYVNAQYAAFHQASYTNNPWFSEHWAALNPAYWSYANVGVSNGMVFCTNTSGNPCGLNYPMVFPTNGGTARIITSITIPPGAAINGGSYILIGFDNRITTNAPGSGANNLFGVGISGTSNVFGAWNAGSNGQGVFQTNTPFAGGTLQAGTYPVDINVDTNSISWVIQYPGHTNEFRAQASRTNFPTIGCFSIWLGNNMTYAGPSVGPVGIRYGTPTIPDGAIEHQNDFVIWSDDGYGQNIRVTIPKNYDSITNNGSLVIFNHGCCSDTENFPYDGSSTGGTNGFPQMPYFQALAGSNYIVASSANHGFQSWGNPASVGDVYNLIQWVRTRYAVTNIFLIGSSMGGAVSANFINSHQVQVAGFLGQCGVMNLQYMVTNGFCQDIYQAYSTTNVAQLLPYDPLNNPATPLLMAGVPVNLYNSLSDVTVNAANNAIPMVALLTNLGPETVWVQTTGGHLDPSNYQPAASVAFFNRCSGYQAGTKYPYVDAASLNSAIASAAIATTSLTGTLTNQINNITGVYTNGWMVFMQSNSFGSSTPPQDTNHIYIMVSTNMPGKWYVSSNSLGNNVWMPK